MKRFQMLAATTMICLAAPVLAEDAPEKCWQSAVSTILSNDNDTHTEYATCMAACEADAACAAWNFRPHSFDSSMAGHCQLLGDVYKTEASDRAYCGKIAR